MSSPISFPTILICEGPDVLILGPKSPLSTIYAKKFNCTEMIQSVEYLSRTKAISTAVQQSLCQVPTSSSVHSGVKGFGYIDGNDICNLIAEYVFSPTEYDLSPKEEEQQKSSACVIA